MNVIMGHFCLTMRNDYWIISFQFLLVLTQVSCDGVFQLKFLSYRNQDQLRTPTGTSCICSSSSLSSPSSFPSSVSSNSSSSSSSSSSSFPLVPLFVPCPQSVCSTSLRVCLGYFASDGDPDQCLSSRISHQRIGEGSSPLLEFPFNISWPGAFTLTIEAKHCEDCRLSTVAENSTDENIFRITTRNTLKVGNDWTHFNYLNQTPSISSGSSISPSPLRLHYKYRVICDADYYGPNCANYCRPRNDRFGHYNCSDNGDRICHSGWNETYCEKALCLPGCNINHGFCDQPNECKCRIGWQGKLCDECIPFPGCQHGTCHKPWHCDCLEGWGGLFCNQDLMFCSRNRPCRNGSTCLNSGLGSYTCLCQPGFTGRNCDVEVNRCQQLTCLNGGTCQVNGSTERCDCRKGFRGVRCESFVIESCSSHNPCANGGTCLSTPPIDRPEAEIARGYRSGYVCVCASGFTGVFCDVDIRECLSNPCQNGGSCVDGRNGYQCLCPPGFDGLQCQTNTDECKVNPCLNDGVCVDKIGDFECRCPPGFVGTLCEVDVDECLNRPCANGAVCSQLVNDFVCFCAPGFAGRYCTDNINECASGPCQNKGLCIDRVNRFECRCPTGFYGDLCQESVLPGRSPGPSLPFELYGRAPEGEDRKDVAVVTDVASGTTVRIGLVVGVTELSARQGGTVAVSPTQQVLLIVCFGFGIPAVVIGSVFLLWIYRKRRHRPRQESTVGQRTALNNQRAAGSGRACPPVVVPGVVSYDAENCQISCGYGEFSGSGGGGGAREAIDFTRRLNAAEIEGLRRSLRDVQQARQLYNNLRSPLRLNGGYRATELDSAGGERDPEGQRSDQTTQEEGAFDWSARQSPSTEKTHLDESPLNSQDFKVPEFQDTGRSRDFAPPCPHCEPWSTPSHHLQFAHSSHCPGCQEQFMATEV